MIDASLAQLVEHDTLNVGVQGSSPWDKGVSTQNIPELPIPRSMMHCMGRQLSTAGKSMMHENKKTDNRMSCPFR